MLCQIQLTKVEYMLYQGLLESHHPMLCVHTHFMLAHAAETYVVGVHVCIV